MRKIQNLSMLFAVIGICLLAVTALFCMAFLNAPKL